MYGAESCNRRSGKVSFAAGELPTVLKKWAKGLHVAKKLESALHAISEGASLRVVEQRWGVPRSIVFDAMRRKEKNSQVADQRRYLSNKEEMSLFNFF